MIIEPLSIHRAIKLTYRYGLSQHKMAMNSHCQACELDDPDLRYIDFGGILELANVGPVERQHIAQNYIPGGLSPSTWNDAPTTTMSDVRDVLHSVLSAFQVKAA